MQNVTNYVAIDDQVFFAQWSAEIRRNFFMQLDFKQTQVSHVMDFLVNPKPDSTFI